MNHFGVYVKGEKITFHVAKANLLVGGVGGSRTQLDSIFIEDVMKIFQVGKLINEVTLTKNTKLVKSLFFSGKFISRNFEGR